MTNLGPIRRKMLAVIANNPENRRRSRKTGLPLIPPEAVAAMKYSGSSAVQQSIRDMVASDFLLLDKYREQQLRASMDGVHPDIAAFSRALINKCANMGIPMFANETWRGAERQKQLYVQGVSSIKSGGPHEKGFAVDIIHSVKGWALSEAQWAVIGHMGKELIIQRGYKLDWGGEWKNPWDPAHWQVKNWRKLVAAVL